MLCYTLEIMCWNSCCSHPKKEVATNKQADRTSSQRSKKNENKALSKRAVLFPDSLIKMGIAYRVWDERVPYADRRIYRWRKSADF